MNKRIPALLLMLLLALPLMAVAEPAPALETTYAAYTHPRFGYQLEYPAHWVLMEKDSVEQIITAISEGKSDLPETAVTMFEQVIPQIEAADIAMMVAPEGNGHNFNLNVTPLEATPPVDAALSELAPMLKDYYGQMYPNIEWVDEASLSAVGQYQAMKLSYRFAAEPLIYTQTQYFVFADNRQYTMTFTWISPTREELAQLEEHMAHIIGSFVPPVE